MQSLTRMRITISCLLLALMGCEGSTNTIDNTSGIAFHPVDPEGTLAGLTFSSAQGDAHYHCLLSALTDYATTNQLKPSVVRREIKDSFHEINASWCRFNSEGDSDDSTSCNLTSLTRSQLRGTYGIHIFAEQDFNGTPITNFGYRSDHIPLSLSVDWRLLFQRRVGSIDGFQAYFAKAFGAELVTLVVGSDYIYTDPEFGLSESISPTISAAEQLQIFSESRVRFTNFVNEYYSTLHDQVRASLNSNVTLGAEEKSVAMAKVKSVFDSRVNHFNRNADDLHALLLSQIVGNECL